MEQSEHTNPSHDLAGVRRELADARATLRLAQDNFNLARLLAEFAHLASKNNDSKAVGSNDEDRKRAYGLACEQDATFVNARNELRAAEAAVALLEASLDILKDARREREHSVFERYVDLVGDRPSMFSLPHLRETAA